MKILIFCPYYPPHMGGLESHADEFNKYLSQKNADITVFTPQIPNNSLEYETKYNNVKIIRFPAFEIIANYPLPKFWKIKLWKLWKGINKGKFNLVISRTRFFSTSLLALLYSRKNNVQWVHIEHGSDFVKLNSHIKSFIARLYDYSLGKIVLKFSNKNIANSQASADFCRRLSGRKPCDIVYRGVEMEKIKAALPNWKLKNKYFNSLIITYLGRLIDGKGIADLLRAVKKIKNERLICFIVGDGPQRKFLGKLAKELGISDKICFLGRKNFEDAMSILKISDIFVNPSYTEGLPTAVIEAALCKTAIIATNVGGTPEIMTDIKSGFLIKPKQIDLLAHKIKTLLDDEELRKRLSENAYREVKNKFNWDNSIRRYLEIFSKMNNKA